MKGSWFIFDKFQAHADWCRWRAPYWHGSHVMEDHSHANYHLSFRCCNGGESADVAKAAPAAQSPGPTGQPPAAAEAAKASDAPGASDSRPDAKMPSAANPPAEAAPKVDQHPLGAESPELAPGLTPGTPDSGSASGDAAGKGEE
jgi:hypothetical protein